MFVLLNSKTRILIWGFLHSMFIFQESDALILLDNIPNGRSKIRMNMDLQYLFRYIIKLGAAYNHTFYA